MRVVGQLLMSSVGFFQVWEHLIVLLLLNLASPLESQMVILQH